MQESWIPVTVSFIQSVDTAMRGVVCLNSNKQRLPLQLCWAGRCAAFQIVNVCQNSRQKLYVGVCTGTANTYSCLPSCLPVGHSVKQQQQLLCVAATRRHAPHGHAPPKNAI